MHEFETDEEWLYPGPSIKGRISATQGKDHCKAVRIRHWPTEQTECYGPRYGTTVAGILQLTRSGGGSTAEYGGVGGGGVGNGS